MSVARPPFALVTGASSGIGRALAVALAQRGYELALVGRDAGRLDEAAAAAGEDGAAAVQTWALDLTDDASVASLGRDLTERAVDALVHCAGMVQLGAVRDVPVEVLDLHYAINVRAPYVLTRELLPGLEAARGHVVFVNSGAGRRAHANWGAYAASKFALRALADSLRAEVAASGVRVTTVYPGRTATPMQRDVRRQEGHAYDAGAFARAEDVAGQIAALLAVRPPSVVNELSIGPA